MYFGFERNREDPFGPEQRLYTAKRAREEEEEEGNGKEGEGEKKGEGGGRSVRKVEEELLNQGSCRRRGRRRAGEGEMKGEGRVWGKGS